jgi:hypothetical protein
MDPITRRARSHRRAIAIAWPIALSGTSAAFGQAQGVGHWISEVTTQDGDSIVEPGESATVSLWMDMTPSVGEMLPDGTKVYGFGLSTIDVLGGLNAEMGQIIGWAGNNALDDIGNDGTSDGISIFNVELGQLALDPFDFSDPIFLMSFEWGPTEFTSFDVSYDFDVETFLGPGITIWKDDGTFEAWPVDRHSVVFAVIPSPASIGVLLIAGLAHRRSRRSLSASAGEQVTVERVTPVQMAA